jgi:hypothetical protein
VYGERHEIMVQEFLSSSVEKKEEPRSAGTFSPTSFLAKSLYSSSRFHSVKYVPLNYAIRFSGPRGLTHRPPRPVMGVRAGLICHLDSRPGIKTRSSPAAFPTTLSFPFSFFSPLHSPHTDPVVSQASASSTFPCSPPPPQRKIRRGL